MNKLLLTALVAGVLAPTGCNGSDTEETTAADSSRVETTSETPTPRTETPTPAPSPTDPRPDRDGDGAPDISDYEPEDPTIQRSTDVLRYPSGDAVLPGYPVLVDTATLDFKLSDWIATEQAVAVAPGVYVAYSPAVPTLADYLDEPVDGDCVVIDKFFPETGSTCWNGVVPSPQEPAP
jgi:hypothetical protein